MTKKTARLLLGMALVLWAACGSEQLRYPHRQVPDEMLSDPAAQAAGAKLFAAHCARCHGKLSEGRSPRAAFFEPPAPDFTAARYAEADPAYLFWRIATGKTEEPYRSRGSVMPAWGPHLTDTKIWHLVAYLRSRARG